MLSAKGSTRAKENSFLTITWIFFSLAKQTTTTAMSKPWSGLQEADVRILSYVLDIGFISSSMKEEIRVYIRGWSQWLMKRKIGYSV